MGGKRRVVGGFAKQEKNQHTFIILLLNYSLPNGGFVTFFGHKRHSGVLSTSRRSLTCPTILDYLLPPPRRWTSDSIIDG